MSRLDIQKELNVITNCINKVLPFTNYTDYILTHDILSLSSKPYTLRLIYDCDNLKYDTLVGQQIWDWLSLNFIDVLITMNKLMGGPN